MVAFKVKYMKESKINCNLKNLIFKKLSVFYIPKDSSRLKGENIYLGNQKFNIKLEMVSLKIYAIFRTSFKKLNQSFSFEN